MASPLADRIRPTGLDDFVGQEHILGKAMPLRKMVEEGQSSNLIFFGPPGTGKTTLAEMIAARSKRQFVKLNGTTAKTSDIQQIIAQTGTLLGYNGILLYLDEIQYLNKKQQQIVLEHMENGSITLIASTTENPYFYVYPAIISRSIVFEFLPVEEQAVARAVARAFSVLASQAECEIELEDGVCEALAASAMGDVRKSVNFAEFCYLCVPKKDARCRITLEVAQQVCISARGRYDKDGDMHYDLLSAFQKSIRGSDPDAAVYYLARLLESGDLISPARRLLVIASEDIGLAYPQAAPIVKALVDAAFQLGLPEARIPLSQAVLLLATSPKSNSAITAIEAASAALRSGKTGDIPPTLKDVHYPGAEKLGHGNEYQYSHDYPNHYVKQQFLPDIVKNETFYVYGDNKNEQAAKEYWKKIKGE